MTDPSAPLLSLDRFHGLTVGVLGLARSGRAAVAALTRAGARVIAWDDQEMTRAAAATDGIVLEDPSTQSLDGWAALVMSPGIPLTHPTPHPLAVRAQKAGVPVIADIELLYLAHPGARLIAITGTNGKSTTTTLIGHILDHAGIPAVTGGNLGRAVLTFPAIGPDGAYVIETSSFQLDLLDQTRFDVALLLNITPDHLDRHGDMLGYVAAKKRIFRHQGPADLAIVGIDDDWSGAIADALALGPQRLMRVSVKEPVPGGLYVEDRVLIDDLDGEKRPVVNMRSLRRLPGRHNAQNVAAAYGVARHFGLEATVIRAAFETYPGLAHRQELIVSEGLVDFINNSKATNADAAEKALGCYERIFWIAGGVAKAGGINSLTPYFPRIAEVFLIGAASAAFAQTLAGRIPYHLCETLETATAVAAQAARHAAKTSGQRQTVLLSPACASFDQFPNFEVRGDRFRALVTTLTAQPASEARS